MSLLLVLHLLASFALLGLIWTIQVLHYPLFARVETSAFAKYHAGHMRLTTLVVAPLVLLEFLTAGGLWYYGLRQGWFLASLVPLGVIWGSTFLLQVPLHARLALNFDAEIHRKLVRTNWLRTTAWSLRAACLVMYLLYGISIEGSSAG